ncbi:hypothetical protein GUITHDRAFT_108135 [Guillardia theta CCMP2712]|uniref:Uncharacterized protein n=1 Tax=Guillardia theta (strain CCMP2712) TaxID=905079 RepID=L1JDB3_GUITC|nr:hypothetical protein GUITHDRAFT_108135 [Guillardia theta CCMP2712]EKX46100.1 hypothetical protein GUITHDRAFT_108135 [Guillardia theta CCMP2712]|eukprot:XP_005833080.1 hypothetical protein GUITHDRAFT_108135 [Guillardia theta CCMP2712]
MNKRGSREFTPSDREQGAKRKRRSHTPKEDTSFQGSTFLRVEMFAEARECEIRDAMAALPACSDRHARHGKKAPIGGSEVRMMLRRRATSHRRYKFPLQVRLRPKKKVKLADASRGKAPQLYRAQRRYVRNMHASFEGREGCAKDGGDAQRFLSTHLWHVKRMKMGSMWGYRLPLHVSFRGSKLAILTRTAAERRIFSSSSEVVKDPNGKLFNDCSKIDKRFMSGGFEVTCLACSSTSVHHRVIGPAQAMCRPSTGDGNMREALLWINPQASAMLQAEFEWCNKTVHGRVRWAQTRALARFELQGPTSDQLLEKIICPSSEAYKSLQIRTLARCLSSTNMTEASGSYPDGELQLEAWNSVKGSSSYQVLPPGSALALTCIDPRLVKALRSAKGDEGDEREGVFSRKPWLSSTRSVGNAAGKGSAGGARLCRGAFWDLPSQLRSRPLSDSSLHAYRQEGLLTFRPATGDKQAREGVALDTSVLLIRADGRSKLPRMPSTKKWVLLLPGGWSRVFWNALILNGGRAIGVMEHKEINLHHCSATFPFDYPDSLMYKEWSELEARKSEERSEVLPPSVRVNYRKLGTRHAVVTPESWTALFGGGGGDAGGVVEVIRERLVPVVLQSEKRGVPCQNAILTVLGGDLQRRLRKVLKEGRGEQLSISKTTSSELRLELPREQEEEETESITVLEDVGGYVTSGCHNFLTGRGFAMALLKAEDARRVMGGVPEGAGESDFLVVVRNNHARSAFLCSATLLFES